MGHVRLSSSHWSMQDLWNRCLQGRILTVSPILYSSMQTVMRYHIIVQYFEKQGHPSPISKLGAVRCGRSVQQSTPVDNFAIN